MQTIDVMDLPARVRAAAVAVISRIDAMHAVMDAALCIPSSGPIQKEKCESSASAVCTSSEPWEKSKPSMTWSLTDRLKIRGAVRISSSDSHREEALIIDSNLQHFQDVLRRVVSIPHRDHMLESALLEHRAAYLEPPVWAKEYGSYGQALVKIGYQADAVEWIMSQCDHLHPIYEITDEERRDILIGYISYELRALRSAGA